MKAMDSVMDRLARIEIHFLGRGWRSFQVCGLTGLCLGILLGFALTNYLGLSLWVLGAILAVAIGTFFALAMITKIIVGREVLIYYHHEVAILSTTTLVLWLLDQPVLPYLDVTILGIGTFLCFGRIGCFLVGCCHGLPNSWGVCYGEAHADAGFTRYFTGVRLFPIQLLESAWVLSSVVGGVSLILSGSTAGEALAWYVIMYGVGRFSFEFFRGDPDRPYRLGFSDGQWTSLALMSTVIAGEMAGSISFHPWHVAATAGVAVTMVGIVVARRSRRSARHKLLHPRHIQELAGVLERLERHEPKLPQSSMAEPSIEIAVGHTTEGIQLSAGKIETGGNILEHYTLSARDSRLEQPEARVLADLILELKHRPRSGALVPGQPGIFHLLTSDPHRLKSE
jgi:hypothetical protein